MDYLVIIFAVVALFLLVLILRKRKSEQSISPVLDVDELVKLRSQLAAKDEEIKYLKTKIEDIKKSQEENEEYLTSAFKNLASQILEDNSEKFKRQNKEQLGSLLNPLGKEIENFKKKVEETNKDYIDRNSALTQKIQSLESLNLRLSQDAINLTNALKGDSKAQGDWGEIQLEVLLEKSGLTNGVHFSTQGGYRDEEGHLKKPDFIR